MSQSHYILDDERRPVAVDLMTWARWFEDFSNRRVAEDFTRLHRISTVFLGLDYSFGRGPPILFETMVFEQEAEIVESWGGRLMPVHADVEQWRYASWDDAETGHKAILSRYERAEAEALEKIGIKP